MNEKLLDWAVQLAIQEELARKAKTLPSQVKPTSRIINRRNIIIKGEEVVFHVFGSGILEEFMAKAEDTDFQVLIEKDGEPTVLGSYNEYAEISQDIKEINAYEERNAEGELTGAYIFKVNNIEFAKNITVKIITAKPIKFRNIFSKFTLG